MTPAARIQTAIEILDQVLAGKPAEQALTGWARRSRYAGSKDRAAVRDHVFDVLRCRRSLSALGGGLTGRGLMLGLCRRQGIATGDVFTGAQYAPAPLTSDERAAGSEPGSPAARLDIPDWLWPRFSASLGENADSAASALQARAPVHLRVNLRKADRAAAQRSLAADGVDCVPHPVAGTALEVIAGSRRIRQSAAYLSGLVELQDGASQAVAEMLPLRNGLRVLDYCAGGGGKALAMTARAEITLFAHDTAPQRMRDLPQRAARGGVTVTCLNGSDLDRHAPFDLVLCDAPCSGSGAWRRAPEGKWVLTNDGLARLVEVQAGILRTASRLVGEGGTLAYATCSVLEEENAAQVAKFLRENPDWALERQASWKVQEGVDGFFAALLTRRHC